MNWLNYHHLLYFWTVAQEGSIAIASRKLHLSPATISIQLRRLEKSLGVKLFEKSGRKLVLTEMGFRVQSYARDIFSTGQELIQMVQGHPTTGPSLLRVGVKDVIPKLIAYQFLAPILENPREYRLACYEGDGRQLVADLAVHKLDILFSDTPVDPSLKVRVYSHLLGESDIVFVGTKRLAKQAAKGFPRSLNSVPVLLPMGNSVMRRSLDIWFEENQVLPIIHGEFDDSAMMKAMGKVGLGVFPVVSIISQEVQQMYEVEEIARVAGLSERYYALSSERKIVTVHGICSICSKSARRWSPRFSVSRATDPNFPAPSTLKRGLQRSRERLRKIKHPAVWSISEHASRKLKS